MEEFLVKILMVKYIEKLFPGRVIRSTYFGCYDIAENDEPDCRSVTILYKDGKREVQLWTYDEKGRFHIIRRLIQSENELRNLVNSLIEFLENGSTPPGKWAELC